MANVVEKDVLIDMTTYAMVRSKDIDIRYELKQLKAWLQDTDEELVDFENTRNKIIAYRDSN